MMQRLNSMRITAKCMSDLQRVASEAPLRRTENTRIIAPLPRPTLPLTFSKRKQLPETPSCQRRFNRRVTAN